MHYLHREVNARKNASRKRQVDLINPRANNKPLNFTVGDFVLVRCAISARHKLIFKWIGPRRVTSVKSELGFEVYDLLQRKAYVLRCSKS